MIIIGSPGGTRPPFPNHPPADPATNETLQGIGAGRREAIRGRESDAPNRARGRLIPHASAVGALMVAMIEAPFRTALMPAPGGTDRGAPGVLSARARAVRMSAITGGTNREEVATATTGLLAEGWIHGVGVRARTSDWTSRRNRGTTDTTGSNGRSSRRSRGSGGHPGPHLRVLRRPYLSRTTGLRPRRGLWTLTPLWTHASTSGCGKLLRSFPQAPQPSSSSIQSLKNTAPSSSYPSTPGQVSALSNGQRH